MRVESTPLREILEFDRRNARGEPIVSMPEDLPAVAYNELQDMRWANINEKTIMYLKMFNAAHRAL